MWDRDRKAEHVVLGQGVIEIHLLDNNKQFSVTQRLAALCLSDEAAKHQNITSPVSII